VGASVLAFVEQADLAVIVATPEPTAIADAYATIKCAVRRARRAGLPDPAMCLVVNQACDAAEARRVSDRMSAVANRFLGFRVASIGWVPRDEAVSRAVCARRPFAVTHPRSSVCRAMHQIAEALVERTKCAGPDTSATRVRNPKFWGT
jgi:flagellar biosynthesis protein FlhG